MVTAAALAAAFPTIRTRLRGRVLPDHNLSRRLPHFRPSYIELIGMTRVVSVMYDKVRQTTQTLSNK